MLAPDSPPSASTNGHTYTTGGTYIVNTSQEKRVLTELGVLDPPPGRLNDHLYLGNCRSAYCRHRNLVANCQKVNRDFLPVIS